MLNQSKSNTIKYYFLLSFFIISVFSVIFFTIQMLNYDRERKLYIEKSTHNSLLFAAMELMQISQNLTGLDQRRSASLYAKEYEKVESEYNDVLSILNSLNEEDYQKEVKNLLVEFSEFNSEIKVRNDYLYRRNNLKVILENSLDLSTSEENSNLLNIIKLSLESKNMLALGEYYRDLSSAFSMSNIPHAEREKIQEISFGSMNAFDTMEKIISVNVILNRHLNDLIYKTDFLRATISKTITRDDKIPKNESHYYGYILIAIILIFITYLYTANKNLFRKLYIISSKIKSDLPISYIRIHHKQNRTKTSKEKKFDETLFNIKLSKIILDKKKSNFIVVDDENFPFCCSTSIFDENFKNLENEALDTKMLTASIYDNHYFLSKKTPQNTAIFDCDIAFSVDIPNENKTILFLNSEKDERLRQNDRLNSLASISGTVAHDINNMITVIVSSLSILRESKYLTLHSDRKVIDSALFSADKSIGLIDRLLTFARCKRLAPEIVDVNALLEGLYEVISFATNDNVTVEYELSKQPLFTYIDPGQLETSIINLCLNSNNAIGESGFIKIKTEVNSINQLSIIVEDNGHGIPKSIQGKVFEPFFTGRKQGEGHGLGLSMVYGFVTQSGGSITLDSQVGKGTTISISFSLKKT